MAREDTPPSSQHSGGRVATLAPRMGAVFLHNDRRYRVTGWLKGAARPTDAGWLDDILFDACQPCGPDKVRLQFCARDEAQYVCGAGVAGCVARVTDVEVVGMVSWTPAQLADDEKSYERRIGEMVC